MRYIKRATPRSEEDMKAVSEAAGAIVRDVASRGDEALREICARFDGAAREDLRVSRDEIDAAWRELTEDEIADIRAAHANIERFAKAQRETMRDLKIDLDGMTLGHAHIPVDAALCYVPGGSYPLYSTALMLVTPAKAAGVRRVAACSPVVKGTTSVNARTLVAMDIAGADEIWAVGGAQAIAAFAHGTESIAPVDMIVGPGNAYVAEAKRICFGRVGIDFVAGPSEVMIVADEKADARTIAADILAQCEHDLRASGLLVTTSEELAANVAAEVERQLASLPTADIARRAWESNGEIILAASIDEAAEIANGRAPEHLELQTAEADGDEWEELAAKFRSCGSLFVGGHAAEVFGDYASGPNHTLPTSRAARYTGGLWVGTFLKTVARQKMTPAAAASLAPLAARLARGEGLEAHARAAEARI